MLRADAIASRRHALLVAYRGASDIAAKAAMFVVTVVAARQLSRADFGLFAIASTLGWLGSVVADFGIQLHLARTVSLHPESSAPLLRRWLPVRVSSGVLTLVVSLAVLLALGLDRSAAVPMLLFTLAYGCTGLSECLYYFFRGLDRTDLESTITLFNRGTMVMLAGAVLWWRPSLSALGWAMLIPAIATLVVTTVAAVHLAPRSATHDALARALPVREFVSSVAPIGIGLVLSALYFRVDVFLLERWSGTTAVALYNAVFRIVDALRLFPAAVLAVALPELCRAADVRPLVRLAAPLTAAAAGAAVVLWLAASALVPTLYGVGYVEAVPSFRTLLLALPLMALNYALTSQLIGWHGHRAYAVICAGALATNLVLNWRLIPLLGPVGAAWATVWTEAWLTGGCVLALAQRQRLGIGSAEWRHTERFARAR